MRYSPDSDGWTLDKAEETRFLMISQPQSNQLISSTHGRRFAARKRLSGRWLDYVQSPVTDSVVDVRNPHREGKTSILVGRSTTEQDSSNNERHKVDEITTKGSNHRKRQNSTFRTFW